MNNTEQNSEVINVITDIATYVMISAVEFLLPPDKSLRDVYFDDSLVRLIISSLLPSGKTLKELGFEEYLMRRVTTEEVKVAFEDPMIYESYTKTCLALAQELNQIVGKKDA